jgi:hypothetical protein
VTDFLFSKEKEKPVRKKKADKSRNYMERFPPTLIVSFVPRLDFIPRIYYHLLFAIYSLIHALYSLVTCHRH